MADQERADFQEEFKREMRKKMINDMIHSRHNYLHQPTIPRPIDDPLAIDNDRIMQPHRIPSYNDDPVRSVMPGMGGIRDNEYKYRGLSGTK